MNLYLRDGQEMEDDFTEQDARQAWFQNRGELMRGFPPAPVPFGLVHFEPDLFASVASIHVLRLRLADLQFARSEFDTDAHWHRDKGRPEQAEKFERLAGNVRTVINELEGGI
jgi:hypothetical protein